MNNTTLTGRLTRDPEVRHNAGSNGKLSVAKYTLAVRRPRAKEGQPTADFIRCTAFGPKAVQRMKSALGWPSLARGRRTASVYLATDSLPLEPAL